METLRRGAARAGPHAATKGRRDCSVCSDQGDLDSVVTISELGKLVKEAVESLLSPQSTVLGMQGISSTVKVNKIEIG